MRQFNDLQKFRELDDDIRSRTYLSLKALGQVRIKDNNEPLVNLFDLFKKSGEPVVFAIKMKECLPPRLREGAALRLLAAARDLGPNFRLKITDAFRPIAVQRRLFKEIKKQVLARRPDLSRDESLLYEELTKFIMDPKAHPPHAGGGAVDLTLINKEGQEVDMGTPIDAITELSQTFHPELKENHLANRRILFEAMTRQGFVNLPTEWWHYSYGDQYWAAFWNLPEAIYGEVEQVE